MDLFTIFVGGGSGMVKIAERNLQLDNRKI